jgi:hypothetical protein
VKFRILPRFVQVAFYFEAKLGHRL